MLKKTFYFWAAMSLVCMVAIFLFSSQTSKESSRLSGSVTQMVFGDLNEEIDVVIGKNETMPLKDILDMIVRKIAHISIYFILSFCVTKAVGKITDRILHICIITISLCSFYAATDEWHQYFVPGRSCRWQDWLIDAIGVLLGVFAAVLTSWAYHKFKTKKSKIIL